MDARIASMVWEERTLEGDDNSCWLCTLPISGHRDATIGEFTAPIHQCCWHVAERALEQIGAFEQKNNTFLRHLLHLHTHNLGCFEAKTPQRVTGPNGMPNLPVEIIHTICDFLPVEHAFIICDLHNFKIPSTTLDSLVDYYNLNPDWKVIQKARRLMQYQRSIARERAQHIIIHIINSSKNISVQPSYWPEAGVARVPDSGRQAISIRNSTYIQVLSDYIYENTDVLKGIAFDGHLVGHTVKCTATWSVGVQ